MNLSLQRKARQDAQLRSRIVTIHIGRGIGLGIACALRIRQHLTVVCSRLHGAQDEVACPVHDAADAPNAIAAEPLHHSRNHWNPTRHCRPEQQLHILFRSQIEQFRSAKGDELFFCSDDVLACAECSAQPAFDGVETTNELDDRVHVWRGQNIFNTISPGGTCRDKLRTLVLALALHATVKDPRDLNLLVRSSRKNLSERTANCTEPKQTYPQAALLSN